MMNLYDHYGKRIFIPPDTTDNFKPTEMKEKEIIETNDKGITKDGIKVPYPDAVSTLQIGKNIGYVMGWKAAQSLPTEEEEQIKNKILKFSKQILVHELWLKHCSANFVFDVPQWMTEEQFFNALTEIGVIDLTKEEQR